MRIGANACANALVFRHLTPDAHVVDIDGDMVALKLSRDHYFNLSYDHSQALRQLIGWPHDPAMSFDAAQAMQSMFDADDILAPGERGVPDSRTAIRDVPAQPGLHAWAEAQGHVVGDDLRRREQLAVIFETPA